MRKHLISTGNLLLQHMSQREDGGAGYDLHWHDCVAIPVP